MQEARQATEPEGSKSMDDSDGSDLQEFISRVDCNLEHLPDLALMNPQRPIRISILGESLEHAEGFLGVGGRE